MDITRPHEREESYITPSTVVKGALIIGLGALFIASLSRQDNIERKLTGRVDELEKEVKSLQNAIIMIQMQSNKPESKTRRQQKDVFADESVRKKRREF